jgi:hypothetical protein
VSYEEQQARGCASYAAVNSGLVVESSPDYSGRTYEDADGRWVVLDRETHGARLWRVRRPDGRMRLMRPSALEAALRRQ